MSETPRDGDGAGLSATDVDPRFDDAAAGTQTPRPETPASPQDAFAEITTAATGWVRSKPLQALGIAAGLGFLLGRSGR